MIDDRIAERRREVRRQRQRRRRRRTLVAALVLALAAGLVAIERSALVALDEVRVTGTDRLTEDEVLEAAALELGTSTLRLGLGGVTDRVTGLPLVAQADARRLDPLTVEIEVEERVPALMAIGGDTAVLIDREGVVLMEETLETVPEIILRGSPPEPGQRVAEDAALTNAYQAWRGLSGPLRAETIRYMADSETELTLELAQGIEVRFGRAERIDEKVRALGRILEDVGDTPIEAVDVRAPRAPVVVAP